MIRRSGTDDSFNGNPGIAAVARREWIRIKGDRCYLLLMVVFPLIAFVLIWGVFQNESARDLPVAVYDADNTMLSRKLVRMIDAGQYIKVSNHVAFLNEGRDLVLRGTVYAFVVIPLDFERDVKRGAGAEIIGYYNAQTLLPGNVIFSDLNNTAASLSAGVNAAGRMKTGDSREKAAASIEPIRINQHILFNPYLNYVYFLESALLPNFLQLFIMLAVIRAFSSELKYSTTMQWLECSGGSVLNAVLGKLFPYFLIFSMLGFFSLLWMKFVLRVPINGSMMFLMAGTELFVCASLSMGVLTSALYPSFRMANSSGSFYAGAAFAFAGLTFPLSGMPPLAKAWAYMLPLTHYIKILVDQVNRGAASAASTPSFTALSIFLLLGVSAIPIMGLRMKNPKYWGLR